MPGPGVHAGRVGRRFAGTKPVNEAGRVAHARHKFREPSANQSSKVGKQAPRCLQVLFKIEEEVAGATAEERRRHRQPRLAAALYRWLIRQRLPAPDGSATARAIDDRLKRRAALTRCIADRDVPNSNDWVENQIRPIALRRPNWLFGGSLQAGKRAAAIRSLAQSAKINGHDACAYLLNP